MKFSKTKASDVVNIGHWALIINVFCLEIVFLALLKCCNVDSNTSQSKNMSVSEIKLSKFDSPYPVSISSKYCLYL